MLFLNNASKLYIIWYQVFSHMMYPGEIKFRLIQVFKYYKLLERLSSQKLPVISILALKGAISHLLLAFCRVSYFFNNWLFLYTCFVAKKHFKEKIVLIVFNSSTPIFLHMITIILRQKTDSRFGCSSSYLQFHTSVLLIT